MNTYDLVLHVDKTDKSMHIAFTNAVNYAKALQGKTFKMVLVVNSGAVAQLRADNYEIKESLEEAVAQGVDVRVCQNALNANGIKAADLFPLCSVVPAGLVELVDLQRAGYAYIKP